MGGTKRMYGIDLGTTMSTIGKYIPGEKKIELEPLYPSVVDFESKVSGYEAIENLMEHEQAVALSFKTNITSNYAQVASSVILKALKDKVNDTNTEVVISVPAYFNAQQREATIKSANRIGYEKVYLINEPTSAIIQYGRYTKGLFLVYDLGGGTFDISLMDVTDGYRVISTKGISVGGDNLDAIMVSKALEQLRLQGLDIDETDKLKLKFVMRELKHKIQQTGSDGYVKYNNMEIFITLEDYKKMLYHVFNQTLSLTASVIQDNKEQVSVVFVGGSTRDPFLREMVIERLNVMGTPYTIMPINYNQDLMVAQGAAYYAHLIESGAIDNVIDIIPYSIGIGIEHPDNGPIVNNLITKNAVLPTESQSYFASEAGDTLLSFEIYADVNDDAPPEESKKLGFIEIPTDPNYPDIFRVMIKVDASGVIYLKVKPHSQLMTYDLEIKRNENKSEERA